MWRDQKYFTQIKLKYKFAFPRLLKCAIKTWLGQTRGRPPPPITVKAKVGWSGLVLSLLAFVRHTHTRTLFSVPYTAVWVKWYLPWKTKREKVLFLQNYDMSAVFERLAAKYVQWQKLRTSLYCDLSFRFKRSTCTVWSAATQTTTKLKRNRPEMGPKKIKDKSPVPIGFGKNSGPQKQPKTKVEKQINQSIEWSFHSAVCTHSLTHCLLVYTYQR